MQWPEAATRPSPPTNAIQNVAAMAKRRNRAVISRPPTRMISVGGHHPAVEGSPPKVEGFHPGAAQNQEGQDQPDVRWIEDVGAAEPNDIFG